MPVISVVDNSAERLSVDSVAASAARRGIDPAKARQISSGLTGDAAEAFQRPPKPPPKPPHLGPKATASDQMASYIEDPNFSTKFSQTTQQGEQLRTSNDGKTVRKTKDQNAPDEDVPTRAGYDAAAQRQIELKFPETSNTGKLLGVGVAAYGFYFGVMLIGTDGASVEVNEIRIEDIPNSNDRKVTIIYDRNSVRLSTNVPGTADAFNPTRSDTINLSASAGLTTADYKIIEEPTGNSIKIIVPGSVNIQSLLPANISPPYVEPGPVYTRTWSSNKPTMTVYTDFLNQLSSGANSMLDLVTNVLIRIINAASSTIAELAPAVTNLVKTATDAAGDSFCTLVPFICDITTWLLVGLTVIVAIIFYVVLSKK